MADVFISYPRKDQWIMRTLRAEIEKAGFTVWADEKLEPGKDRWLEAIPREIEDSRCVVVVITENTRPSEWIEREVRYAHNYTKGVIPVLITADEIHVPIYLVTEQRVDLHYDFEHGIYRLLTSIGKHARSHPQLRLERVGSLYWLGCDLGQLSSYVSISNARDLKRYLRQIAHHAQRLQFPSEIQERFRFLRDSTARFSDEDWKADRRKEIQAEIFMLIGSAADQITPGDLDWEPFDPQNTREGLA